MIKTCSTFFLYFHFPDLPCREFQNIELYQKIKSNLFCNLLQDLYLILLEFPCLKYKNLNWYSIELSKTRYIKGVPAKK